MKRLRVLLLEPQNLLSSTVAAMIECAGHHAMVVKTPDQTSVHLEDRDYDTLIIGQPRNGFCPYAVAEKAKRVRPDMRVVFARVSDEVQSNNQCFDAVLDVPYTLIQLLGVLNTTPT